MGRGLDDRGVPGADVVGVKLGRSGGIKVKKGSQEIERD